MFLHAFGRTAYRRVPLEYRSAEDQEREIALGPTDDASERAGHAAHYSRRWRGAARRRGHSFVLRCRAANLPKIEAVTPSRPAAFIVRAIRHQAALLRTHDPRVNPRTADPRFVSPSVDDYVADILYNEIQPATVTALADDEAFLEAYHYPPLD
jgi:hypothetical protein